jgi:hypothetical protein
MPRNVSEPTILMSVILPANAKRGHHNGLSNVNTHATTIGCHAASASGEC